MARQPIWPPSRLREGQFLRRRCVLGAANLSVRGVADVQAVFRISGEDLENT
jgi:hypothetical protein